MSKVPPKKHDWHLSANKQEERRIINKKRRKKLKIKYPYRPPLNDNGTSAGIPTKEQATPEDYAYWDKLLAWRDNPSAFKNERHVLDEALYAIPAWYMKGKV